VERKRRCIEATSGDFSAEGSDSRGVPIRGAWSIPISISVAAA